MSGFKPFSKVTLIVPKPRDQAEEVAAGKQIVDYIYSPLSDNIVDGVVVETVPRRSSDRRPIRTVCVKVLGGSCIKDAAQAAIELSKFLNHTSVQFTANRGNYTFSGKEGPEDIYKKWERASCKDSIRFYSEELQDEGIMGNKLKRRLNREFRKKRNALRAYHRDSFYAPAQN